MTCKDQAESGLEKEFRHNSRSLLIKTVFLCCCYYFMFLFNYIAHHTCTCINTCVSNQKFRKIKQRENFLTNFSTYIFKLQRTPLSQLPCYVLAQVFHLLFDKSSNFLSHFHCVSLCSLGCCLI